MEIEANSKSRLNASNWLKTSLLILVLFLPALTTFFTFITPSIPEISYPLGKAILILFPVAWLYFNAIPLGTIPSRWNLSFRRKDLVWGLATGMLISVAVFILYVTVFANRLTSEGIVSTLPDYVLNHYVLVSLFLSLGNAFMEEYFWRAFVLSEMSERFGWPVAVWLNGPLFGLHHWVILQAYFPLWQAAIFTLGTIAGGWLWSWMRMKGLSSWSCYVSHLVVDLAVLAIGYIVVFA